MLFKVLTEGGTAADLIKDFMQEAHEAEDRIGRTEEANEDAEFESAVKVRSHTLEDISAGTGLAHEDIRQAMREEEDEIFVHLPHPTEPTRYALAGHVHGAEDWQPGVDF